ncbi:Mor transcription activator family protein [Pseudoxanthomonas sp. 22568]|uniref:Mor transcription activator family protein n=1 Tax=Pseudoxanthomonas sp. 22568 TaxID=3453945 RepID=UPI003F83E08B
MTAAHGSSHPRAASATARDGAATTMAARREEFLEDLAGYVRQTLAEHGIDAGLAEQCGASVADEVAEAHGGQDVYVPRNHAFRLVERDRKILEEHRAGVPLGELRRRHGMTEKGLRKLLRRANARDPHLNQIPLFGG